MKGLPKGMIADRDNQVYFDTERGQFYMIQWTDGGNSDIAERIYIEILNAVHSGHQILTCLEPKEK